MSADRLREAAKVLRINATGLDGFSWTSYDIIGWACDGSWVTEHDERTAAFMALLSPTTGLALADWLDAVAERRKPANPRRGRSHAWTGGNLPNAVADAILGGQS